MSKGMKTLAVNSGVCSVFYRTGLTGLITINSTIDLWELPTGAIILRAELIRDVLDTTNTADPVLETTEAAPRTLLTLDISAASYQAMSATAALRAPIAGTAAQRKIRIKNTVAGTGDGSYTAIIECTRQPLTEPGASA